MHWLTGFLAWSVVLVSGYTSSPTRSPIASSTVLPTIQPTTQPITQSSNAPTSQPSATPASTTAAPTSSTNTTAPSRPPSASVPTNAPVFCQTPTDLTVPGRVQYSTFDYPTSYKGCQWNLHAGTGNTINITIQSHIAVELANCGNYPFPFCVGYTDGRCDQTSFLGSCGAYPCMNNIAMQYAASGVSTAQSNATSFVCPLACGECASCNAQYVIISDSNGVELYRSCGLSATPVTVAASTPDVTVQVVRGFMQQLNCRTANETCGVDIGTWAYSIFALHAFPLGPNDYVDFTWSVGQNNPAPAPTCGGVAQITSAPGIITAGNTGGHYANNANCTWVITAPAGQYVSLKFMSFNLQPSFDSKGRYSPQPSLYDNFADYLTIRDGTSNVIRGPFAGTISPGNLTSVSQSFEIIFQSDDQLTDNGFVIEYDFVSTPGVGPRFCSGEVSLNTPGEVIQDENYPGNSNCLWTITAPAGQYVKIDWQALSLDGSFMSCISTSSDVLQVQTTSGRTLQYICGVIEQIPSVTSLTNTVQVKFTSDAFVSGAGFHFVYSFVSAAGPAPNSCSGPQVISGSIGATGTIGDGLLLGRLDNPPRACSWLISAPAGATVHFYFIRALVHHCPHDLDDPGNTNTISIFDGQDLSAPALSENCGSDLPSPSDSTSNQMLISFVGDGGDDGFFGFYEIRGNGTATNSASCQGIQTITSATNGTSGVLQSGSSGNKTSDCTWHIVAPAGQYVQLQLMEMEVGVAVDGCKQKWIGAFDGVDDNAWPFFSTCGTAASPSPISVSTGSNVTVHFVDVAGDAASNFQIAWKFVSQPGDHSAHCWNQVQANPILGSTTSYSAVVGGSIRQLQTLTPLFRRGLWCAWSVQPKPTQIVQIKWAAATWSGVRYDAGLCGDYVQLTSDPSLIPNPSSNYMICANEGQTLGPVYGQDLPVPTDSYQFSGPAYIRMMAYQDLEFVLNVRIFDGPVVAPTDTSTSAGLIAGIVILVLIGVCGVVGLCCYYDRWKQNKKSDAGDPSDFDLGTGQNLGRTPVSGGTSTFDFGRVDGHQRMHSEDSSMSRPASDTI